jgi:hypothetical protein
MRCAVVNETDGVVVNIIVAEPSDLAPLNCVLIGIPDDVFCDIGWKWDGVVFVDPNPPVIQPDTPDG